MTDVLHVAVSCAADGEHAPHSAAMIDSVLEHRGGLQVHVHYLTGEGYPEKARRGITEMVERTGARITFHHVEHEKVAGFPVIDHAPSSLWYRILLPQLLPDEPRVLYLDTDVIAVDSLAPLWATDLGDHYLAGVTNVWQHNHFQHAPDRGVPRDEYFNSGVLLFNLEAWRREDVTERLRTFVNDNIEQIGFADQDAMNMLFHERRLHLHPRWNVMNSILVFPWASDVFGAQAVEEARRNPAIRHFEGPSINKPWHYLCAHDMRDLYLRHRRRTPWPRVRLEGRTPRNVLKRALSA